MLINREIIKIWLLKFEKIFLAVGLLTGALTLCETGSGLDFHGGYQIYGVDTSPWVKIVNKS